MAKDVAHDAPPETVEHDPGKSTAGHNNNTSGIERPTLPPSVGPDPNVGWDVARALESGEISEDEPVGQGLKALITTGSPVINPPKAKPGKVAVYHHDDGWSGRLVFKGWHEGHHKGYVRLDADTRDVKFPVEWVGPETVFPLTWRPGSVLAVVDGGAEQRVSV